MRLLTIARCAGFSAWLAFGATALAQPARPAAVAEARTRGQALMAEDRPREAERVYLDAFEATGTDSLLRDVADARLAAGDGPGAVEALERFLAAVPRGADAEAARQRIAEIQQMPATLSVQSTPPGAEVRVDGAVVGTTPMSAEVAPGEHALEIAFEGHAAVRETLVLAFGTKRALDVELEAEGAGVAAAAPQVEPAQEPAIERDSSATPAIWALAGVSAAALLTGTVFGFKALSEESDFVLEPTDARADRGERYSIVADLGFGVAAATAVTAFVLWLKADQETEGRDAETARVRVVGAPRGVGLGAELEF